ncbi:DNA polymerase III subunit gamma/tau [Parasphingopyxis lamellibrachiae]|uniref:DNA polymerase III subunit gamma/tau n=1 Tax=Parasphingopyxis lamellibrachiae TaxID=680125 RepID=A0A3D9FCP6_9SPHN|nr:DNA polymerase III subunit gamma/tau [Parasphingopyxis lamellibrachiae]RED15438.1 DNA polymerase-3 subunit gamma/tau [Parasphingopyxis lamellibrachiae]
MSDSPDILEPAADSGPGLGLGEPPQPAAPESAQPYRVLARKYRPQSFAGLIGQDAMVQTLGNAIKRDRLAHAFLLTGVRGVGKTTTARLIAKALNCVGPDGEGGPTIDPCGTCEPCVAIAEGRHIDVVEMDAASHTGVDDVREIIEAVRYSAVSARFKIYIIDEVHMLSKNAFNALLKTLEEPPPHVKFLFATTEVNKVPVTVLSRCQRFDLRRIPADKLAALFRSILEQEGAEAEDEALALIARAAEGSARDGLSILDQAIAHGTDGVTAAQVREMIGLSDRGAVRALFGQLLAGEAQAVLATIQEQHDLGTDPASLFRGLLETAHGIVRAKVGGADDPALSAEERAAFADWASRLGFAPLHRIWQLLLKGLHEVETAPMPLEAAEMALLRIVHAAGLPDPGELARKFESGEMTTAAAPAQTGSEKGGGPQGAFPPTYAAMVKMVADSMIDDESWRTAQFLERDVRLVRYEPPHLVIHPTKPRDEEFFRDLGRLLREETGQAWTVETSDERGEPSLLEQEQAALNAERESILQSPMVKAAFGAFPDAELIDYKLASGGAA